MEAGQKELQHLSWRAGFGDPITAKDIPIAKLVKQILEANANTPIPIIAPQTREIRDLKVPGKNGIPEEQKAFRKQRAKLNREGIRFLNEAWLEEMFTGSNSLREKMALFWHGHFACRIQNPQHQQALLQVIRTQALGNFGVLLMAVSKSPAMLQFLNNQKNKKMHPNENFGREVMELFTMGRGNYTERDVKEASRAFTGWSYNKDGQFILRKKFHDDGIKEFLGKKGRFTGEQVLAILLDHPATAKHVVEKLYRFLVNDQPDEARIDELAKVFYHANYDIPTLLQHVFSAEWFYAKENIGARIKSPIELLVGLNRMIPVRFKKQNALMLMQRIMGQVLFYPPNVAGWPGGRSWIDSTTLMFRMRIPQIIYYSEDLYLKPKEMPEEMDNSLTSGAIKDDLARGKYLKAYERRIESTPDWEGFFQKNAQLLDLDDESMPVHLLDQLLAVKPRNMNAAFFRPYTAGPGKEQQIKKLIINIASLPEYQLC